MLNVLIAGVGGQGSVLAAKILAQAAAAKGWQVRTAETIGMAQRGGSVASHVRMGNEGEPVHSPLVFQGAANCIIALEPGEGLRALPFLAPDGLLVTAQSGIASVAGEVSGRPYNPAQTLDYLRQSVANCVAVDDAQVCQQAGSPKVLNVALLAAAVQASNERGCGMGSAITVDELKEALSACVKPQFLEMNLAAIDAVIG